MRSGSCTSRTGLGGTSGAPAASDLVRQRVARRRKRRRTGQRRSGAARNGVGTTRPDESASRYSFRALGSGILVVPPPHGSVRRDASRADRPRLPRSSPTPRLAGSAFDAPPGRALDGRGFSSRVRLRADAGLNRGTLALLGTSAISITLEDDTAVVESWDDHGRHELGLATGARSFVDLDLDASRDGCIQAYLHTPTDSVCVQWQADAGVWVGTVIAFAARTEGKVPAEVSSLHVEVRSR